MINFIEGRNIIQKEKENENDLDNHFSSKILHIIKNNLIDILLQKQIYNSLIIMNRFIQSPLHFKMIFSFKRKCYNSFSILRQYLKSKKMNSKLLKANFFEIEGKSSQKSKNYYPNVYLFAFTFLVGSTLLIYEKKSSYKKKVSEIKALNMQTKMLLEENKALLNKIKSKI